MSRPGSVDPWPAIAFESLPWRRELQPGEASRSQRTRFRGPYQAAVLVPIADSSLGLTDDVLAESEDAAAEIARFDSEMGGEVAPFEALLLRSESAASSQIEDLTASARAIAETEIGVRVRANAEQIVANTRSMEAALRLAGRLDESSVLAMHRTLMSRALPDQAGRWRDQQVWIGGGNLGPHGAMFVPPHHDRVPDAMVDLMAFVARNEFPVLAHAAVAHAQFETIHPFTDGNGRTGRVLVHAMLKAKDLTRNVTVPVSAGLLTDTGLYFDALERYRNGHPEDMVRCLAAASFGAIANGRQLVAELRMVRREWAGRVTARRDSAVWRVVDLLFQRPVINAPLVASELSMAQPNTYRHIESLVRDDVLVEFTDQKRNRAWRAPDVLEALDAFAERAGRRARP